MSNQAIKQEIRSIGRHSIIYLFGQLLSRAAAFLMIPVYTRYISPVDYGAADLIDLICGMVLMAVAMGLGEAMARFYYAGEDECQRDLVVSTIVLGSATLGLVAVAAFLVIAYCCSWSILEWSRHRLCLYVGVTATWLSLLNGVGTAYLRMRYMSRTFVTISITQLVLALSLNIYLVVYLQLSIVGIYMSTLITLATTVLPLTLYILGNVGWRLEPRLLASALRFGLPLVPAKIAASLTTCSNRLSLNWLSSPDAAVSLANVGILSLADKFGGVVSQLFIGPFRGYWDPRRFQLLLEGDENAKTTIARVCTYATFCSIFLSLMLCVSIESVIVIVADPRYHSAYEIVPWLALAYVVSGLELDLATGLMCFGRTTWMTAAAIVSLAVVVIWDYLFIPEWGVMAAAAAILVANLMRCSVVYIVSQRSCHIPFELHRIAKLLAIACALYVGSRWVHSDSLYVTLLARMGIAAVFPIGLLFIGFYHREELLFIRRFIAQSWALLNTATN